MDSLTPGVTKASQFKKTPMYLSVAEVLEKARGPLTTTPRASAHQAWALGVWWGVRERIPVPVVSGQTMGCWPEPWLCGVAAAWLCSSPQGLKGLGGSVYVALCPWLFQTSMCSMYAQALHTSVVPPGASLLLRVINSYGRSEAAAVRSPKAWKGGMVCGVWPHPSGPVSSGRLLLCGNHRLHNPGDLMPPSVLPTFR